MAVTVAGKPAGTVILEGNYPFTPACRMRLKLPEAAKLPVDFRLPTGATAMELKVNGATQSPERTASGYRVNRTWRDGDDVELKFEFALRAHFDLAPQAGRGEVVAAGRPLVL